MKARTLSNKFVAFLLLFSLLITSISPAVYAGAGDPGSMYLVPPTGSVNKDDQFTVQVKVNTAPSGIGDIHISYDQTKLEFVKYVAADIGYFTKTPVSFPSPGVVNFTVLNYPPDLASGDILIADVTFKALASAGSTDIGLPIDSCTYDKYELTTCLTTERIGATISFTAPPDTEDPTVPTSLTGTVSADKVDLSWGASTDNVAVDSYDIYRDGNPIGNSSTTTYTDSSVSPGQSYDYTVMAKDTSGNYSTASDVFTANVPQVSTPPAETTYSDEQPSTPVQVNQNEVAIVTGQRGNITIACGFLKGNGTVGNINMNCGKVAPGLSPGVLNSSNVNYTGGTYEVELGGITPGNGDDKHDQLNVTGTVDLGSATALSVVHWNNFRPALNNQFVIINNDGSDAVVGTFQGLAQGATLTVDGITYTISYTGGDGNDVVLTATNVSTTKTPATPNTGIQMIKDYSLITLITSILALASLVYIKKFSASKK